MARQVCEVGPGSASPAGGRHNHTASGAGGRRRNTVNSQVHKNRQGEEGEKQRELLRMCEGSKVLVTQLPGAGPLAESPRASSKPADGQIPGRASDATPWGAQARKGRVVYNAD